MVSLIPFSLIFMLSSCFVFTYYAPSVINKHLFAMYLSRLQRISLTFESLQKQPTIRKLCNVIGLRFECLYNRPTIRQLHNFIGLRFECFQNRSTIRTLYDVINLRFETKNVFDLRICNDLNLIV